MTRHAPLSLSEQSELSLKIRYGIIRFCDDGRILVGGPRMEDAQAAPDDRIATHAIR